MPLRFVSSRPSIYISGQKMPVGGSWKRPGGKGWAALNGGQLQSNNDADNRPFAAPSSNPRLRQVDVPEFPPIPSASINYRNDSISAVTSELPDTSESQSRSEPASSKPAVPIEPDEWEEEDDVYSRHRREAVRAARAASRHSKAAAKAFLRGDHHSARNHSLAARHQRSAAQDLHTDAAVNILTLRNPRDDPYNLDLHGLHAAEAVLLLRQHLQRVEAQPQKRPSPMQVITGVGNHSRGEASLPAAVRGFLNENGYYFEEIKPGVVSIRPKFRLNS